MDGPALGNLRVTCRAEEATISTPNASVAAAQAAGSAYADAYVPEDAVLAAARQRAEEVGCTAVAPGAGAALRMLAALLEAHAVVEVGTGAGVSGLWLLRGMAPDGILTTVETEAEHLRLARQAFVDDGIAPGRTRTILGQALDVLPRLTDGAYDLVFCDGDPREFTDYLNEAHRLLRPGGVVVFDHALRGGKVADPAQRDPETVGLRELGRVLREDERFLPLLLPVGDGLLIGRRV